MTDEERTPTQAEAQAQGTQADEANAQQAEASVQEQTEDQGLLARLADTARNAVSSMVETVAERAPAVAENVVGAAKHLVGREHTHAEDGAAVESQDAAPSEPDSQAGESSSIVATVSDAAGSVAETVSDAAQTTVERVRSVGARAYDVVTSAVGGEQATSEAPQASAETTTEGAQASATQETPAAAPAEGASFEPTETTAKSGKPRRFKDVQSGMQLEGKVTSIALYGVFVDVGVGRDGLVHISEMSDTRIESPTELVQIGDPVTVWVKSVDADARRISLTMRDPNKPKPQRERRGPRKPEVDREKLAELKAGDTIEGTISSLAPFGAFVDIGVGKDGLVHISELAEGRVEKPEDAVQVGERYTFKVLEVDPEGKRISLSLRRAMRTQRMQQLEPGTVMDGTVSGIAPFGAFVDVGVGRDGLVHISELTAERIGSVEEAVKVGDKVQVKVIEIDPTSKRISLTMRVDEPLPNDRERPAGRVGSAYSSDVTAAPDTGFAPSYGGGFSNTGGGFAGRGEARGGESRGRGGFGEARGGGRTEGRGEARGGARGGRGGDRDVGRGNRLGGRGEGRGGRREGQVYEPSEEVYTFEDPEEEVFTGDATLEDLVSKFNAGKDRGKDRRRDDDEEDEEGGNRGRRDAIRRTLAMRDED
jgi:ribosomal protein S1